MDKLKKLFLFIWMAITNAISKGKNPIKAAVEAIKAKKAYTIAYIAYDKALEEVQKAEPEYHKVCKKEKLAYKLYNIELDRFCSSAEQLNLFVRQLSYYEYNATKHRRLLEQYARSEKTLDALKTAHEKIWEEFFKTCQRMEALRKNAEEAMNAYDEAYDCLKSFGVLITEPG